MEKEDKLNEFIGNELNKEAKSLKANDSIRLAALQALREKNKKKAILPVFIGYKVPIWMAAAAILLILLLIPSTFNSDINKTGTNTQLAVHDTVYVERVVTDTIKVNQPSDTVVKTVYVKDNSSNQLNEASTPSTKNRDLKTLNLKELETIIALNNFPSKIDLAVQPTGKSLSDDPFAKAVLNISE